MKEKKYRVFAGRFHVTGYSPDGDSIRFEPYTPQAFVEFLNIRPKRMNKFQLRLEAIDALETHYEGYMQPRMAAIRALEHLLERLDISDIEYSMLGDLVVSANDAKEGYVLTRSVDGFKRPIVYIFPKYGHDLDVTQPYDAEMVPIEQSVNFQMAAEGHVYPTFYNTMHPHFLRTFQAACKNARELHRGLWFYDKTAEFDISDLDAIQTEFVILPKLFRRIVKFASKNPTLSNLKDYLKRNGGSLYIEGQSKGEGFWRSIDYDVERHVVRLMKHPEELVFKP